MAPGPPSLVVLVLCLSVSSGVFAIEECKSYTDRYNIYHPTQTCSVFCCGRCNDRKCCFDYSQRLSKDDQDECEWSGEVHPWVPVPMIIGIVGFIITLLIVICCCVCPCCCLYKLCRKQQPVMATTHTTVVTSLPQQYPQQPTAAPGALHPYQGPQYPPYQPMPVQPGYGTQGMPALPYQGKPLTPGPPPTYQEAIGPIYPPQPMPYSQAAYGPGQPTYPLQPPVQPQPNVPPTQPDYLAQPAYNPDYVAPPQTG